MSESPFVITVTRDTFADQVLVRSQQVPVLVDFWADWCAPCKMLMPVLAKLAEEYAGQFVLAKVNTDEQQDLAAQYGIRSLPTVKLFKAGAPVDEFMGAQPESSVRAMIDRHIVRESDRVLQQATTALEQGDATTAQRLAEDALRLDPDYPPALVTLARILMGQGQPERAEILLDDLRGEIRDSAEIKQLRAQLNFARVAAAESDRDKLTDAVLTNPQDLEARHRLSAHFVLAGEFEPAMEQLLEIMKTDRSFGDDAGRKGLLAIFDILGSSELATRYRSKMFNLLH